MPYPPKYENLWLKYREPRHRTRIVCYPGKEKYYVTCAITKGKYKDHVKHANFWSVEDAVAYMDKLIDNPDELLDYTADLYGYSKWVPKGPTKQ